MVATQTNPSRDLGFDDLLKRWPSFSVLADDLGIAEATIRSWASRNSVPQRHWAALEESAKRLGVRGVNYRRLREVDARVHPPRNAERDREKATSSTASPSTV